jgi:uncharacterized RDD family membrane protein YckC
MSTEIPPNLNGPASQALSPIPSGAGFGIRLVARLLDWIYGIIIGLMVGFAVGILFSILSRLGKISPQWPQLIKQHPFSGFWWGLLGAFLYHAVAEGVGTVTIGKLICGLRVVQMDGGPATMKGSLIRDLAYYIDGLFFGLIGYMSMQQGTLNQRYGDLWGKTVVVKANVFQPYPRRSEWRMFAGILLGTLLWGGALLLQVVLKAIQPS